ncbi:ferrous iron transport protein B [Treponema endosymbiont of Eucomonympha sp.]|uniref:ferrous iron transport protein B n=3 Tax=Treponema endosymbiont of Eucomonympha sp. TaxID=1580831 RepID=UPI000751029F|nr:ferrous iron transport protein B [Treponema endosymbiont of Eucomonympha sp.]
MALKIALAGNPNAGKTTLFNALTGSNQFVGNWPGVTVEKKEGRLKGQRDATVVDLPGIYSLSPYSLEEVISRNYILEENPDVILNIIDGTNLERNLFLTTQLLELGVPVVAALNMMDAVEKSGDSIHAGELQKALGCPVVGISALKGTGVAEAAEAALKQAAAKQAAIPAVKFNAVIEGAILALEPLMDGVPKPLRRFYALKTLERDEKVAEKHLFGVHREHPDPLREHLTYHHHDPRDPIRDHLAHRRDRAAHYHHGGLRHSGVELILAAAEQKLGDDAESAITEGRYQFIERILPKVLKRHSSTTMSASDRIDRVVTNRICALPIFAAIIFCIYFVAVTTVGAWVTDWTNDGLFGDGFSFLGRDVPGIPALVGDGLKAAGTADWLNGLILDGIIAGVGAVIGFVPQMLVLFFLLAALEACGYMARIAFILDRVFRRFGLSGKSFIPMLIGTGCGVPGIMASRTIENEKDRRMTVMTTTFMPCGAKLPIIALVSGALFGGAWWVAPSTYFLGIFSVVASGVILKKTAPFAGEPAPFVMELPAYHLPTLVNVLRSMWERGWSFVKKAGSIILLSAVAVWFLSSFGFSGGAFGMVEDMNGSILAAVGNAVAWLFAPLGFGAWDAAVATITGLVAKENVVGTMGVLYGFADAAENGEEIWTSFAGGFTKLSAFTFLSFNLYCPPCFAAIGAIRREMNSAKWTWFALAYQFAYSYALALVVYQLGSLFSGAGFTVGTAFGFLTLVALVFGLTRKPAASRPLQKKR